MAQVDSLIKYLETLDECLLLKRSILHQECEEIRSLLRPWRKLQLRDIDESTVDQPTKAVEVCPAQVPEEPEYDPINEEIDKVTKLLERVSRVRGSVKDNEIRAMCNIEGDAPKRASNKLPVIDSKGDAAMNLVARTKQQAKSLIDDSSTTSKSKPTSSSRKQSINTSQTARPPSKPTARSSYQSSYKHPSSHKPYRGSVSTIQSSKQKASVGSALTLQSMGDIPTERQSHSSSRQQIKTDRITDITNKPDPPASSQTSYVNTIAAHEKQLAELTNTDTIPDEGCRKEIRFNLKEHGQEMKVPKSMRLQTRLNSDLRKKVNLLIDGKSSATATTLPVKLESYFGSVEQSL